MKLPKALYNLVKFASKESSRYVINSIHIDPVRRKVTATDGRVCVEVEPPSSEEMPDRPITIPAKQFEHALRQLKKDEAIDVQPMPDDEKFCELTAPNGMVFQVEEVEGNYPRVEQVIPTEKAHARVAVDPEYLRNICDHAHKSGSTSISIEIRSQGSPITTRFHLPDKAVVTGILMPLRKDCCYDHLKPTLADDAENFIRRLRRKFNDLTSLAESMEGKARLAEILEYILGEKHEEEGPEKEGCRAAAERPAA